MPTSYNATAIIVDDTDPSVQYSNGWNHQEDGSNYLGAYNATWTDAFGAGLTATFSFEGWLTR
jgi:hypothetical protein